MCNFTTKPIQIYTNCFFIIIKGSIRFGSYCYNIGAETKTFDDAKQACSVDAANLVDVGDRYIFICFI